MISLAHIPVAVDPLSLADQAGVSATEAAAFLDQTFPIPAPSGVFDEVNLRSVLDRFTLPEPEWDGPAAIALLSLGLKADRFLAAPQQDQVLWEALMTLTLRQSLDFLEYRLRQYLKPTGRYPGPRLVPGCPEMPLLANQAVLEHFSPEHSLGLELAPSGEIAGRSGLALIYPLLSRPADIESRCARCTRRDCPARRLEE